MTRSTTLLLGFALALLGCYHADDTSAPQPGETARVLLTDAPFPYDSVASVDIYISRIDASAAFDTSGPGDWTQIVAPRRRFNLLALQQGTTALLGEGSLEAGQYRAIRMVIDTDSSWIRWHNGSKATVNWQNGSNGPIQMIHVLVEAPVNVTAGAPSGAEIVIDFDVGRSFLFDFFGTREFTFVTWIRAVHTAITGSIEGFVTSAVNGAPVRNVNISVLSGDSSGTVVATGRTSATGFYRVAFLRTGRYSVRYEQPEMPFLASVLAREITVTAGQTVSRSVVLPRAGGGGAYIQITGPGSVGVGGTIALHAAVGDAGGNPVSNPTISWALGSFLDTAYATLRDSATSALVTGKRPGTFLVMATSGALADTARVTVIGSTAPVANITVSPASLSLQASDSGRSYGSFTATLTDAAGNQLVNRAIAWSTSDSTIVQLLSANESQVYVRGLRAGTAQVRATSEGKTGQASVTVSP
jgi:hypothetical protein